MFTSKTFSPIPTHSLPFRTCCSYSTALVCFGIPPPGCMMKRLRAKFGPSSSLIKTCRVVAVPASTTSAATDSDDLTTGLYDKFRTKKPAPKRAITVCQKRSDWPRWTRNRPSMRIIALPDAELSIRAYGSFERSLWIAIKIKHNGNRPNTLQKYRNLRTRGRG